MSESARRKATLDDFWAIPADVRFHELVAGEIVEKAVPSGEHGGAGFGVIAAVGPPFQHSVGRGGPGGWWFGTEVEILLEGNQIVRPDVAGWRRDRCPERPIGFPVRQRPDWACEILSPTNTSHDTVTKHRLYHRVQVGHYWLVDPQAATLTVMRWSDAGYVTVLSATRDEVVRAEPFDAIEIAVGTFFGDDPPL